MNTTLQRIIHPRSMRLRSEAVGLASRLNSLRHLGIIITDMSDGLAVLVRRYAVELLQSGTLNFYEREYLHTGELNEDD